MYLALYRKWRPKLFNDVVAQKHVALTLKNEVRLGKVAHAYLFTGPKGTGKTSCARIFSKAVNCLNSVDGEPCLECEVCRGIEDGTILDVVEMDGASSNSVNDVKILKDEAGFVPSYCRFKIYVIDEVHMLSTSAFNALLKIMEEPPDYVIFILATTEVKKVLPTIVSRCQRFDFRRVGVYDITGRLFEICKLEGIGLTERAALRIASMADGSLRDAVSILDECSVACGDDGVDLKLVNQIFGLADESKFLDFFDAVVCGDCSKALNLIDRVYCSGVGLQGFCSELACFFREVVVFLVCGSNKDSGSGLFLRADFEKILFRLRRLNLNFVVEVLSDCIDCFEGLKASLNVRMKFELFVLNLCLKFKGLGGGCEQNDLVKSSKSNNLVSNEVEGSHEVSGSFEFEDGFDSKDDKKTNLESVSFDDEAVNLEGDEVGVEDVKDDEFDFKSSAEGSERLERFVEWPEILDELKIRLDNVMLSGFLTDSEAFVTSDGRLYISFKNPVVGQKVFEKKDDIALVIKQKTGHNYKIFIKKDEFADLTNKKFDYFLDVARKCNIEICEG